MAACRTQWRMGFGGATGLDYNAVFLVAGARGIEMDGPMLDKICLMEDMMLERWGKEADKPPKNRRN